MSPKCSEGGAFKSDRHAAPLLCLSIGFFRKALRTLRSDALKSAIVLCAALSGSIGTASAMGLTFEWGPTKQCFDPKSPPVKLADVPRGTKKLRFKLVDLDATSYPHGGDTIRYAGKNSLPYGAFHYAGPCPPSPHTYMLSVEALDSGGKALAKAQAKRRFP